MSYSPKDIPDQTGKIAIVTGATGGLGYETARMLAEAGADVVIAGRNGEKGARAVKRIETGKPRGTVRFELVDLGNLQSIADFAARMRADLPRVDLLVNNAGVMTPPTRKTTSDGFELQFGTNHLGHFALTGQLLPLLVAAPAPRVVTLSSGAAHLGRMQFEDLHFEKRYRATAAYGQSKLANLLFARRLQQLSDANGWNILSVTAHPGYARTDLIANGPGEMTGMLGVLNAVLRRFASHDAAAGALPTMLVATGRDVRKLDYYGPSQVMELKGPPKPARFPRGSQDDVAASRLWEVSERLTGVHYAAGQRQAA